MLLVAVEEVSRACATTGLVLAVQELGSLALRLSGSEEAEGALPARLARGEWLAAYALTEAGSGSDSAAMRPRLVARATSTSSTDRSASSRTPASRGLYTVFAKTDPEGGHAGISCFVVRRTRRGSRWAASSRRWDQGVDPGELFFSDCRVPAANLVGEEGDGFRIAMRILDRSRPGIAAQALGIAQGATDYALEYAKSRETMGEPIAEHQLVAAKLAEMETRCEAGRGLLYKAGLMMDEDAPA